MRTYLDEILETASPPSVHLCGCNCKSCRSGFARHPRSCTCPNCQQEIYQESPIFGAYELLQELSGNALQNAVQYNTSKAASVGWLNYFNDIVSKIFRLNYSPDAAAFAGLVAQWQAAQGLTADGMLGPGTWAKMKGLLGLAPTSSNYKYPEVNVLMPKQGPGYYCRQSDSRRYGLPETIEALKRIGLLWSNEFPNGPRVQFSDISPLGGGHFPPHASHQVGLDVDIRPVRKDTREEPTRVGDTSYSFDRTKRLIEIIRANGILRVQTIAFLDYNIPGLARWSGHADHLHVRFCFPPNYSTKYPSLVRNPPQSNYTCA